MIPQEMALYKYCRLVYDEVTSWKDHGNVASPEMRRFHDEVIKELNLIIGETDNKIVVTYQLSKEALKE